VANAALSQNLKRSIYLAHQIHSWITTNFGIKFRGVKFGNFKVLWETIALCPSILIELCFLSNWDEAKYLSENSNLKGLAFSILNSLIKLQELWKNYLYCWQEWFVRFWGFWGRKWGLGLMGITGYWIAGFFISCLSNRKTAQCNSNNDGCKTLCSSKLYFKFFLKYVSNFSKGIRSTPKGCRPMSFS